MTRSGARPSDALRSASSGESPISTDSTGYIFVLMNKNNFTYLEIQSPYNSYVFKVLIVFLEISMET